jgi:hypothetical protein
MGTSVPLSIETAITIIENGDAGFLNNRTLTQRMDAPNGLDTIKNGDSLFRTLWYEICFSSRKDQRRASLGGQVSRDSGPQVEPFV